MLSSRGRKDPAERQARCESLRHAHSPPTCGTPSVQGPRLGTVRSASVIREGEIAGRSPRLLDHIVSARGERPPGLWQHRPHHVASMRLPTYAAGHQANASGLRACTRHHACSPRSPVQHAHLRLGRGGATPLRRAVSLPPLARSRPLHLASIEEAYIAPPRWVRTPSLSRATLFCAQPYSITASSTASRAALMRVATPAPGRAASALATEIGVLAANVSQGCSGTST